MKKVYLAGEISDITRKEYQKKTAERWRPSIGEKYYVPNYGGGMKYKCFINNDTVWDNFIINHSTIFKTKEGAINYLTVGEDK